MKFILIISIAINFCLLETMMAIPMASEVGMVEGDVVSWVYRNKIKYSRSSESGSVEYEIPSHYIIIKNADASNKDSLVLASNIARSITFTDRVIIDIEDEQICLYIKSDKINPLLIVNSRVKIIDYKISEFNGSIDASYKNLTIDSSEKK